MYVKETGPAQVSHSEFIRTFMITVLTFFYLGAEV